LAMENWRITEILITGKAYPSPSETYMETVCTGGITRERELIRIYPIPFRYQEKEKQYKKWDWIKCEIAKALKTQDPRIESFKIRDESIKIIREATENEILNYVLPHVRKNHDNLDEYYKKQYGSLGFIRIQPLEFYWVESSQEWGEKQEKMLKQLKLIGPQPKKSEKVKWDFKLKFKCWEPCSACQKKVHDKLFLTWEIYEAFRNFRDKYGSEEEGLKKVKEKFLQVFSDKKYCLLLLGTHIRHHNIWMIGSFYCPKLDNVERFKSCPKLFDETPKKV